jgi:hypothetical protein
MNDYDDGGAGASKARNKLATYLRAHGLSISGGFEPPSDEDFWQAIQTYARAYTRLNPQIKTVYRTRDETPFGRWLIRTLRGTHK